MVDWWSYPTNYSNGTSASGVADFFVKYPAAILPSGAFGSYFGCGFTLLVWLIGFGLSLASGGRKALMTASFIAFIFSLYFVRLGVLNISVTITLILLTIIGAIGSKSEGQY